MTRRALLITLSGLLALVLGGCPGGKKAATTKTGKSAAAGKTKKGKPIPKAAPFDRSKASKTPWLDAEVGHYAIILAVTSKEKSYCKVTKVENDSVRWTLFTDATFTTEQPNRETIVDLQREETKFQDPATLLGTDKSKVTTEELTIGDKKLKTRVILREIKGRGVPTKNWVADRKQGLLPFLQTVGNAVAISERGGKREYEIIEFGKK